MQANIFMPFLRRLGFAVLAAMAASPVLADGEAASSKGKTEYILAVSWQPNDPSHLGISAGDR